MDDRGAPHTRETTTDLTAAWQENRRLLPPQPGQAVRHDDECACKGTANLFVCCEPQAGGRHGAVTERCTLQAFAQRFATEHKVDLPFVVDPQGKFAAEVNADKELGKKIGIQHTPTIYIVSSRNPSRPFVEVTDTTKLFEMIEAMQSE